MQPSPQLQSMQGGSVDLSGRVALVTGAGVGIGRAAALALSDSGAAIGLHYHTSQGAAEETLSLIRERAGNGLLLRADLTNETEAEATVDLLAATFGRLDVVVNNAGSPLTLARIED